jgi:hypothetical protein
MLHISAWDEGSSGQDVAMASTIGISRLTTMLILQRYLACDWLKMRSLLPNEQHFATFPKERLQISRYNNPHRGRYTQDIIR